MTEDWFRRFVVIDVETTGLDPGRDRITELGLALFEDGELVQRAGFFVDPEGRCVTDRITQITGITQAMLEGARPFWAVYNEIAPLLYGATPVAYNRSFDRRFIASAVARAWPRASFGVLPPALDPTVEWIDPLPLARLDLAEEARQAQGTAYPSFKLVEVAKMLGLPVVEAHRADVDAALAGYVLGALHRKYPDHGERGIDAVLGRIGYADCFRALRGYIRKAGAIPEGVRFAAFRCDACCEVKHGILGKSNPGGGNEWTMPTQWRKQGPRLYCSGVCEMIGNWGA